MWKGERQKRLRKNKRNHWKINKNALLAGETNFLFNANRKIRRALGHLTWPLKNKKTKITNKEGFGPKGHLTWPLKPSKKNKNKNKKTQNTKKSVINQKYPSGGGPFLTIWPNKRPPPNSKNRGFSKLFFEKQICATKPSFLDQNKPNQKLQLSLFVLLPFEQQKHEHCWNHYFMLF